MFQLLEGVRVIENAVLINGGSIGMLLGELGADVIKLEAPGRGDYIRDFLGQIAPHCSPAHLQMNKNKRSLALDVTTPEGRDLFFRLLQTTDIFVDGFTPGVCDKAGIGYAALKAAKPGIVYVQSTGYGASGPYSSLPTHGHQMNALAGGTPAEMGRDGLVHPVRGRAWMGGTETAAPGPSQAAPYAALAAVSAVLRSRATGEGAYLDVSAADSVLAASWVGAVYNFNHDRIREFVGLNARDVPHIEDEGAGSARYQLYQAKDGKLVLFCAIEPKFWKNFCRAVGREDLLDAPAPAEGPVDFGHGQTELRHTLQAIFSTRTLAEWMQLAVERDIAMGPAHRLEDVPTDPQIASRGVIHDGRHPDAGDFTYIGYPMRVDGAGYGASHPAPQLAQGGREVLLELGLTAAEIDRLAAAGVIAVR